MKRGPERPTIPRPRLYLVPASVELNSLGDGRYRLSVLWTNGQRGKWDGHFAELRECQTKLLKAMSAIEPVDVSQFPRLRIGSGFEHDW